MSERNNVLPIRGLSPPSEEYGDYLIWNSPAPIQSRSLDWHFARKDFTSERLGDSNCGTGESPDECRQMIDMIVDMDAYDETEEGKAKIQKQVDRGMQIVNYHLLALSLENLLALPGINNLPGFATGTHLESARYQLAKYKGETP